MKKIRYVLLAALCGLVGSPHAAVPPAIAPIVQGESGFLMQSKFNTAFNYIHQNQVDIESGAGGTSSIGFIYEGGNGWTAPEGAIPHNGRGVLEYSPGGVEYPAIMYLDFEYPEGTLDNVVYNKTRYGKLDINPSFTVQEGINNVDGVGSGEKLAGSGFYTSYITPSYLAITAEHSFTLSANVKTINFDNASSFALTLRNSVDRFVIICSIGSPDNSGAFALDVLTDDGDRATYPITPGSGWNTLTIYYNADTSLFYYYFGGVLIHTAPMFDIGADNVLVNVTAHSRGDHLAVDEVVLAMGAPAWPVTANQPDEYVNLDFDPFVTLVDDSDFVKDASRQYPVFGPIDMLMGYDTIAYVEASGFGGNYDGEWYRDDTVTTYIKYYHTYYNGALATTITNILTYDSILTKWRLNGTAFVSDATIPTTPPGGMWDNGGTDTYVNMLYKYKTVPIYAVDIELKCSTHNYRSGMPLGYWYDSRGPDNASWMSNVSADLGAKLNYILTTTTDPHDARSWLGKAATDGSLATYAAGESVRSVMIYPSLVVDDVSTSSWMNQLNSHNLYWSYLLVGPLGYDLDEAGLAIWRPITPTSWDPAQHNND